MFKIMFYLCFILYISVVFCNSKRQERNRILFPDENGNFQIPIPRSEDEEFANFETGVNALASMADFANYFNLELPEDRSIGNFSFAPRFGASSIVGGSDIIELPQALCEPQLTTVSLDIPSERGNSYFPTCVRVDRCGGCCYLSHHSCQPSVTDIIKVKIAKFPARMTKRGRRRVKKSVVKINNVDVVRHKECKCRCRLQKDECNSIIHEFIEKKCQCACINKKDEKKCLSSMVHYWDNDSCKCFCRKMRNCSSFHVFDHASCSCQ